MLMGFTFKQDAMPPYHKLHPHLRQMIARHLEDLCKLSIDVINHCYSTLPGTTKSRNRDEFTWRYALAMEYHRRKAVELDTRDLLHRLKELNAEIELVQLLDAAQKRGIVLEERQQGNLSSNQG